MSAIVPVKVNHVLLLSDPVPGYQRACQWLSCLLHVETFVMGNVAVVSAEFPVIVRVARLIVAVGLQPSSTEV